MYDIVLCVYERFRVDGLKRYEKDDRFRVDGDKNMRLLAFAFTIVFVWTGPKIQRRGRQRERKKKTIGLISKTAISHVHHTFLYVSFPFLHDCDVKMPNFGFCVGRKQATTKFYFSF